MNFTSTWQKFLKSNEKIYFIGKKPVEQIKKVPWPKNVPIKTKHLVSKEAIWITSQNKNDSPYIVFQRELPRIPEVIDIPCLYCNFKLTKKNKFFFKIENNSNYVKHGSQGEIHS